MQTLTIQIKNPKTAKKLYKYIKQLEEEGVEIIAHEDLEDLLLLAHTRDEASTSLAEYLKN